MRNASIKTPTDAVSIPATRSTDELDLRATLGNDWSIGVFGKSPLSENRSDLKKTLKRESALLLMLLLLGLVLMPIAIYVIGRDLFGPYGGAGYGEFFNLLSGKVRSGDRVAWFLVFSPYLALQTLRLTLYGWRRTKSERIASSSGGGRSSQNV